MIIDIAKHFQDLLIPLFPTAKPPVYVGTFPTNAKDAVTVHIATNSRNYEYFGTPSTTLTPFVMVQARGKSYPEVSAWMIQIYEALHRFFDSSLQGVWAGGAPIYLGRSSENYHEFQILFRIHVEG